MHVEFIARGAGSAGRRSTPARRARRGRQEDRPTDAQIEAVRDKFEKTAWAGLEPNRYARTAVEYRERGGGVHVHVLAARFNHEHGRSRPDDPARAGADQPGHGAYIEAANLRVGPVVEADPRELIRDHLVQRVEHGLVRSRADGVAALKDAGLDVPRQRDSHVTARESRDAAEAGPVSGGRHGVPSRCQGPDGPGEQAGGFNGPTSKGSGATSASGPTRPSRCPRLGSGRTITA